MNTCDYGHEVDTDVRTLPIGVDGNILICENHYKKEMKFRRSYPRSFKSVRDFPKFTSLKIYGGK